VAVTLAMVTLLGEAAAELPKCHDAKSSHPDFTIAADKVRACYSGRAPTCFTLDTGGTSGPAWNAVTRPRVDRTDDDSEPIVSGVTIGTTARLCAADGTNCHTFVTPRANVSNYVGPQVYANIDRTVFAVTLDDDVRLYDPSGSLRVTIKGWSHPGDVKFF